MFACTSRLRLSGALSLLLLLIVQAPARAQSKASQPTANGAAFNDSHFHLTNYIQEGTDIRTVLQLMGSTVGRSTLFGIPLQQQWSHRNTGDFAPTYYLDTDAKLYYYSFTDAYIAEVYRSLTPEQQSRFDPMITGFNPTDMYAADHIRRVLQTFPGVFSGIGEFTIHKEFVSSKIAGDVASLTDPALDRILDFAAEAGLVTILHNDIATPFFKPGALAQNPSALDFSAQKTDPTEPINLTQMKDLLRRHSRTTIIWAHVGLGRIIHPLESHTRIIEAILKDPAYNHVFFDISWDEVAKYVVETPATLRRTAEMINAYPDRFLFGSDVVAPTDTTKYFKTFRMYAPLWPLLTPEAREKVTKGNYERLFDAARPRVRAWERAHLAR
jgi:predicted TIM-barrel fold metal-dependent hydrolase